MVLNRKSVVQTFFAVVVGLTLLVPTDALAQKKSAPAATRPVACGHSCNAGVCIAFPQPGQCVPGPDVTVKFCTWNLNTIPGADCVHIMLDTEPFIVHYNRNKTHTFKNVAPGTHTIRLFACNALHQAIAGAFDSVTFHVQYDNERNTPEQEYPMLTYNLPQGEYMGLDAQDILVDFFVTPAPRGRLQPTTTHVEYRIDGRRFMGDPRKTQSLGALSPGYHTVKIELKDQFGNRVPGPFNLVERTILVSPHKAPAAAGKNPNKIQSIPGAVTGGQYWTSKETKEAETHQRVEQAADATNNGAGVPITQETANRLMEAQGQPQDFTFRQDNMDGMQIRKVATPPQQTAEQAAAAAGQVADSGDEGAIDRIRTRIARGGASTANRATTETLVTVSADLATSAPAEAK